jgi:hypothetical protein
MEARLQPEPPDNLPPAAGPIVRRCGTCAKRSRRGSHTCRVLTESIGLGKDCWAWSDDPEWKRVADEATRAYRASSHWSRSLSRSRKQLVKKRALRPPETWDPGTV